MIRAELKTLIGVGFDERAYWPDDDECFSFGLEATIGPEAGQISESFQFIVCTPKWILCEGINQDFDDFGMLGHGMIIIKDYDFEKIKQLVIDLCSRTTGKNWQEVSLKLSRYGAWEFEGCELTDTEA